MLRKLIHHRRVLNELENHYSLLLNVIIVYIKEKALCLGDNKRAKYCYTCNCKNGNMKARVENLWWILDSLFSGISMPL